MSDSWNVGPLGRRTTGLSEYSVVGPLGYRTTELTDYWDVGLLGFSILGCQIAGLMDYWERLFGSRVTGTSDCTGLTDNWDGELYWVDGQLGCRTNEMLDHKGVRPLTDC